MAKIKTIAINKNGNRVVINKTVYNEKEMNLWVDKKVEEKKPKVEEKPKEKIKVEKKKEDVIKPKRKVNK